MAETRIPDLRMVVVLCTDERLDELERLIAAHRVEGYTELPGLRGAGQTGRRLGSREGFVDERPTARRGRDRNEPFMTLW